MAKKRSGQAEFVKWFNPTLEALKKLGGSGKPREVSDKIAEMLNLSDELQEETLSSGQTKFHNQVAWARQYLVWEGLLDSSKHGIWTLTAKGESTVLTKKEANREGAPQVELVDGEKLVEMFQKVELGLTPKVIYEVNLPFFEPFMEKNKK
jgi:restriction system protein